MIFRLLIIALLQWPLWAGAQTFISAEGVAILQTRIDQRFASLGLNWVMN